MRDFRFHFASLYRDRGYSVIPLLTNGNPAVDWRPFCKRRASLGEIAIWFGHASSQQYGIGIVTGNISDLVVVSIERCKSGRPLVTPLIASSGERKNLFFRYTPGTNTSFGNVADVFGEDGFVIAPDRPDHWLAWPKNYSLESIPRFDPSWLKVEKQIDHAST